MPKGGPDIKMFLSKAGAVAAAERWEGYRTQLKPAYNPIVWGMKATDGSFADSPYIFAAYNQQLRDFYTAANRLTFAHKVGAEFTPRAFADWFQERIPEWAQATGHEHATPHVFRKTALQHARTGEDLNERVAKDARLNTSVMLKHYVTERDEKLRQASNRTYRRILASLPLDVAARYGYVADSGLVQLEKLLRSATDAQDWARVGELAAELARQPQA